MRIMSAAGAFIAFVALGAESHARGCLTATGNAWPVLVRPIAGEVLSPFGTQRHPILGFTKMHTGVDYAARLHEPVHAAAPGIVISAAWKDGYRRQVTIRHAPDLETTYAQLGRILVRKGQCVTRGTVIGRAGKTSYRPHLHFEVRRFHQFVDPVTVVRSRHRSA